MRNSKLKISLMAAALASASPISLASAQTADTTSASATEQIFIIGTRRANRTAIESAVPVDVFNAEVLEQQPTADMVDLLRNVIPSFNVGRQTTADGAALIRPPTLRGLSPDEILVMINGKRRHRSALVAHLAGALAAGSQPVDLQQIPAIAVARVEVLRDGASAQYGSDAIAGVINYALKTNDDGIQLVARLGQYYEGDGENIQIGANIGLPLGEGFLNVSAEFNDGSQVHRAATYRPVANLLTQIRPDLIDEIPNPSQITGFPDVRSYKLFVNSELPLSQDSELYFFGNYGTSDREIDFNYRSPYVEQTSPANPNILGNGNFIGPDRLGTGTATYAFAGGVYNPIYLDQLPNGNYDFEGRVFNFNSIFPGGFTPRFGGEVVDVAGVVGYRTALSDKLNLDVSIGHGEATIDYFLSETVNPSMGPESPTEFYAGKLQNRETNYNADFTYEHDMGLASPVTVAFGLEHRREAYLIGIGDVPSYSFGPYVFQVVERDDLTTFTNAHQLGSNGFPGFGPDSAVNNSRKSYGGYLDLEGDVTEVFTLGAAARYEHFSDFGDTFNVKGKMRYAFGDVAALRASASTGFKAPSVGQLFTVNTRTVFQGSNPIETGTLPATNPAAQFFGATPLKPEKALNLAAGFVLTPGSGFNVTIDAYHIKVTDRIGLSGNFDITTQAQRDALRALGVANWATIGRVTYLTNSFDTRTRGVDLVITHTAESDMGVFNTTLTANYNKTKVTAFDPTIIDRERKGDIENILPKIRANITESWTHGDFGIIARANYYGKYTSFANAGNGGDKTFGSEWTFDLEGSYEISEHMRIALGAENLFDNYPDLNQRSMGQANQNWFNFNDSTVSSQRYPNDSPMGFLGGFYYARLSVNY